MTPAVKARRLRHDGTADAVSMRALLLALFLLLGVLAGFGASLRFAPAGDDLRAYIDAQVTRGASSPLSAGTAARTLACYLRASLAAFDEVRAPVPSFELGVQADVRPVWVDFMQYKASLRRLWAETHR